MNVEEVTTLDGLIAHRDEWTNLLDKSDVRVIFLTPEWITLWWKHYGQDDSYQGEKSLLTLLVWDGSQLVGIAPFMLRKINRFGFELRILEFLGCGMADYCDFIVSGDKALIFRAIWNYLVEREVWDIGILDNLSGFADHAGILSQSLPSEKLSLVENPARLCPHVRVDGIWQRFLEDSFERRAHGGRRKKEIRRLERMLAQRGKVIDQRIRGYRDDPQFIRKLELVEQNGLRPWKLFDSRSRSFWEAFSRETIETGWVMASILEVDGQWIGYYFGFQYAGRLSLYSTCFLKEFASCSPGSLLLIRTLRRCFEEGLQEVDFMRGEEEFKFNWSNGDRRNTRLTFHRRSPAARLAHDGYLYIWPRFKSWSSHLNSRDSG
jgi:CelD/BcsL family acetyltransferase involved in cellulose biosynthesis